MPIGIGNFKPETQENQAGSPYWTSQAKVGGDITYHQGVAPFDTAYSPKTAQETANNDIFSGGDVYMQKNGNIRTASDMAQLRDLINSGFSQQGTPGTQTSDNARGELTSLGYDIQAMLDNDRELSAAGRDELQSDIDYYNNLHAEEQRYAEEQFKQMEGTSRVASYRLGQAGTPYEAAQRSREAQNKMRYFKSLEAQKQQKIGELRAAYRKADAERTKALREEIYKIQKDERDFIETERQNTVKNTLDLMTADREERKMGMEEQRMKMEEQKFDLETEKTLAELTGTFRGAPTFEAEQTALKNAIDIAGLTGEFMGAQTLEAKQKAIENAFKELGYNLEVEKFNELVRSNEVQELLEMQKNAINSGELLSVSDAKALGVPYGTTKAQAASMGLMPTDGESLVGGLSEAQRNELNRLRGEYRADPDIKGYVDIRDSYSRILASIDNPSAAGDLALIFNYMKMLDPASVVREGEFATAQNTGSVSDKVYNLYNKVLTGERLTESQRADFAGTAEKLYQPKLEQYKKATQFYKGQTDTFGIPAGMLVRDLTITPKTKNLPPLEKSYTSLDGLIKENPDYLPIVSELDALYPEYSDADIMEIIQSQDFNSVGGDTNKAISKITNIEDGSVGGQCGRFVNKITGLGLGDSYQSKMAKMDPTIKYPEPGMVFVMPYKNTGHTGFVVGMDGDKVVVKDSNYSLNEKVKTHKIPLSKITGLRRI